MMLEKSAAYAIFTECNQTKKRHIVYKYIAFDFDGTLADSVDFCLAVFELVFKKYMGDAAPDREDIYQNFGMNEPGVIRHYMGKIVPEAENDFYFWHRDLHAEKCPELFPGIRELLINLKQNGVRLGILTGRSVTTCKISMDFLKLNEFFESVQTGSSERNDKTAQLLELMSKNNLKPEEIAYVGDALSDAEASIRAGIDCLSAAWAKSARVVELEKINPGKVFTSVSDLQKYIETV